MQGRVNKLMENKKNNKQKQLKLLTFKGKVRSRGNNSKKDSKMYQIRKNQDNRNRKRNQVNLLRVNL